MDLKPCLEDMGYEDVRYIEPAGWCGVMRMLYTCGVCFNLTEHSVGGRFCFDTLACARLFLADWDGKTYPTVGEDGCTAIKGVLPSPQ